jgi:hypothetical protein
VISAVLGVALSTAWFVWSLGRVDDGVDALVVVEGAQGGTLRVDEAVDWTIYLEPLDRSLSGVRFSVTDTATGDAVVLAPSRNDVEYSVGDRSGRPVSRAQLEPGTYTVEVTPADVMVAIGPDVGDRVQQMWLGVVLLALPLVLGGGVVAAVNILRVLRSGPAAPPSSAEPPASSTGSAPPPNAAREHPTGPPLRPPGPPPPPPTEGRASAGPPVVPTGRPPAPPPLPPPDPTKRRDR